MQNYGGNESERRTPPLPPFLPSIISIIIIALLDFSFFLKLGLWLVIWCESRSFGWNMGKLIIIIRTCVPGLQFQFPHSAWWGAGEYGEIIIMSWFSHTRRRIVSPVPHTWGRRRLLCDLLGGQGTTINPLHRFCGGEKGGPVAKLQVELIRD